MNTILNINNIISYIHLPLISINLLSINSVLTIIPEYYLATAILSMAIFFSVLKAQESKHTATTVLQDGKLIKFNFFSSVNYLAILIVFFYIFLSIKQNFIFLSDVVSFNHAIRNDFISLLAKVIVGVSSLVYLVFVQQFLSDQKINYFEYYILILTSVLGFCLLCCSDDLLTAYLAIEMQSLSFYVLASFKRNSSHSVESGVKYFILGSFSTIVFLFGSNLIYGLTGSISIVDFKDLFVWVFSANSFFLSFESISNALESFQDKTSTKSNNYSIQTLQAIYNKFLILKSNTNLNLFDFKCLLLTFGIIETEIQRDGTLSEVGTYVDELKEHIFRKMVQAKDEINNSFYLNNENQILKYYKDLVTDHLTEKSAVWLMSDMHALGTEYEDILDFKQDLYSINSNSDLLNKFKYNWFSIENPPHYNNDLEFSCRILIKSQVFSGINEFFYFNHLSHSLDMAKKISKPITSVDNFDLASQNLHKFNDKIELILGKLLLLNYVSVVDANLILSEILIMLDTRLYKSENIAIFAKKEVFWYEMFSEILLDNFYKKAKLGIFSKEHCAVCQFNQTDSTVGLPEVNFLLKDIAPKLNSSENIESMVEIISEILYSRYSKNDSNPQNFHELVDKCSRIILLIASHNGKILDGLDKGILDYFNIVASFILGSIKNRDIYVDSDFKNFVIDEDLKLNYEYERLNHLKTIAKKFELFGSNTTLSLQEAKSIFLNSKDLLTSNFYTLEKANLYKTVAENMVANYDKDLSFFSSRIKKLKDSNEFSYLISTFQFSFSELKKVLDSSVFALIKSSEKQSDIIIHDLLLESFIIDLNINLLEENFSLKLIGNQELENLNSKLIFVDKFYNLNSDNILLAFITKLISIDDEMNLCDFSLIEQEKYYSIYEKCINGFKVKNDDEFLCTQIIDNNIVDLLTSKKNWVLNPEIEYYKNMAIVFSYMLYYLEPSEFFDNFDLSKNNVDLKNNLNFILHKLETFNKNTHFSLKEVEALFLLLDSDSKYENTNLFSYLNLTEIKDICGKISQKIQDISVERTSCNNNLNSLKLNSLKRLKSFEDFQKKFSTNLAMLCDTRVREFCSSIDLMYESKCPFLFSNNDIVADYKNNKIFTNVEYKSPNCFLIDQIMLLKIDQSILSSIKESVDLELEIIENLFMEYHYEDLLKYLVIIMDRLPHFLSSNEIYDNFSLLPRYQSIKQKHRIIGLILFRLKNFGESFFLTKWEFELLLDEMKNIYNNVADLEKQDLYLALSKTLDPTSNAPCLDVIYSKVSLSQSNDYREFAKNRQPLIEIINYYFCVKELLSDSNIRHDVTAMTLLSIYLNENVYMLDNVGLDVNISTNNNQFFSSNFNQNNEQYLIKFTNIVNLFPFFFNFSCSSSETSDFTFDTVLIELGILIVLISLFFKLALSPFHLWSPDVYEGSPSSSTFFFTVISKLSIFVFLLKICYVSFYSIIIDWQLYSLIVAIVSIIVGSIGGLKQRKFKSILAYSSISNMGLILISFSAGNFEGIKAFFYYFILYIISGLAIWSIFLLLKLKKKIPYEKHNKDLGDFSLLQESNVILAYASVITIFTMSGIPPMVGFLAKVSVFLSLTESSMYFVALISILSSVIATFFYIRVLKVIFFENVLVGKLFYPTNSKDNIIRSILFFLMLFLFVSPSLPSFFAYKTTLFLNKNFY